jgi:hypothetical protein
VERSARMQHNVPAVWKVADFKALHYQPEKTLIKSTKFSVNFLIGNFL